MHEKEILFGFSSTNTITFVCIRDCAKLNIVSVHD